MNFILNTPACAIPNSFKKICFCSNHCFPVLLLVLFFGVQPCLRLRIVCMLYNVHKMQGRKKKVFYTGTSSEVGAVQKANSCLCKPLKSLQRTLSTLIHLGLCFSENILIFHGLFPHHIFLISWFLTSQPGILLIVTVLPLKLPQQQLQRSLLCQELLQLQVG